MSGGAKIMKGLRDALRGNFASVTIEGQTWVRKDCLLSAAPDLLAALKGLVQVNETHNEAIAKVIGRPLTWKDDYLDAARAAIAKAEGRAP
ncbi:MAG: hypothetical protein WBH00_23235 [Xanthobacteraceae bacterium]